MNRFFGLHPQNDKVWSSYNSILKAQEVPSLA